MRSPSARASRGRCGSSRVCSTSGLDIGGPPTVDAHEARLAVRRVDDEPRGVVQPVVEPSPVEICQLESQAKAAVPERKALDVEPESLLGRPRGCQPISAVSVLPAASTRPASSRSSQDSRGGGTSLRRFDAEVNRQPFARRELTTLLAVRADEPTIDDARIAAAVLAEAGAALVRIPLLREQAVVLRYRLARRTVERDLAVCGAAPRARRGGRRRPRRGRRRRSCRRAA